MARPAAASGSMRRTCQRPNRRAEAGNLDHHGWRPAPFIRGCERVRSLRTREAVTEDEGTGKATRAIDPREVPGCQSNARKQALRPAGALINTDRRCTSTTTARARCMRRRKVSCAHKLTPRARSRARANFEDSAAVQYSSFKVSEEGEYCMRNLVRRI